MKLRLRGNTLRLRLSRSEVRLLGDGKSVSEGTQFPGGSELVYSLNVTDSIAHLDQLNEGTVFRIDMYVPAEITKQWACSSAVSLFGDKPLRLSPLEVLIEKDFACLNLEGAAAGDQDSFPNPNSSPSI